MSAESHDPFAEIESRKIAGWKSYLVAEPDSFENPASLSSTIPQWSDIPDISSFPNAPVAWIADSLIPVGAITLLAGEPSCYKTFVADNSPFADRSPYHGIADVRSGIFDRLTTGFDKLVVAVEEIFECEGGRVVVLGYYHGRFRGRVEEFKAQVAHIWTIREGRAVKFQQYLDTLQIARDLGAVSGGKPQ